MSRPKIAIIFAGSVAAGMAAWWLGPRTGVVLLAAGCVGVLGLGAVAVRRAQRAVHGIHTMVDRGLRDTSAELPRMVKQLQELDARHTDLAAAVTAASDRQSAAAQEVARLATENAAQIQDLTDTVAQLRRQTADLVERAARLASREDVAAGDQSVRMALRREYNQVEALLNLYHVAPVHHGMPPSRGNWAAGPDLLLLLTSLVQNCQPDTIIDLGSGTSTVWLAHAVRTFNLSTRVLALDHDECFAEATREALRAQALEKIAEVRHAPLVELELGGEVWPWYDPKALADIDRCDLLVVDGPPGGVRSHSRYPALPMLDKRLVPGARVVLDDYYRPDEREIVARWQAEIPGWELRDIPHEKGTALLTRRWPL